MVKLKDVLIKRIKPLAKVSLLVLFILSHPTAQALGRLFFTPEQRQALDQTRKQPRIQKEMQGVSPVETFTLNGIVKRDDGSITLWINQVPTTTQKSNSLSMNPAEAMVPLPGTKRDVRLKVGESVRSDGGKVIDHSRSLNSESVTDGAR